jgi:hypothetical protein
MNKFYANKGVKRNKKPLQNIVYKVKLVDKNLFDNYQDCIFKESYLIELKWKYERESLFNFHGIIHPNLLKEKLTQKQWNKFCQGETTFIIQRRINKNNI